MKQWIFLCGIWNSMILWISEFLKFYLSNIMLQHPWVLLAEYLKENWYTQKDFSVKIGKKTSEINELIRWKRNITVARDIILTKYLSTAPKFWILKQVDFDYEQMLLKDGEKIEVDIWNIHQDWWLKNILLEKTQVEDKKNTGKEMLQDIIDEEKRQSKYLRENVFQETPIHVEIEVEEDKKEIVKEKQNSNNNISIRDLLREDPLTDATPLSDVFESF